MEFHSPSRMWKRVFVRIQLRKKKKAVIVFVAIENILL